MLKKARQQKHGRHPTILPRLYASQTYRDSLHAIGWRDKRTKVMSTESPWRSTSASPQELKEFKIRSIGFSRQMQKDLSKHSINDLTLLKRKENANDYRTSTWQGPKKNIEPFLAVNKQDSEKDNNSRATENMTTRLTQKQVGGSTKGRGPTCRQLRHRRQKWDQTHWKTSNRNSQHSSSLDDW